MYKRWLGIAVYVFLFLFPTLLDPLRRALVWGSSLVAFPLAGIALLYLLFRFRVRRVLGAVLALILLWLPLYAPSAAAKGSAATPEALISLIERLRNLADACAGAADVPLTELPSRCREISGGCIKIARFPEWMALTHTAGIFIPLTGEAIVNPGEPGFALPFIALHEIAHQKGIMNEGKANLYAFTAAMASGDPAFQYSACVYALRYALLRLKALAPEQIPGDFPARVRRDMEALGAWDADTRAFPPWAGDYAAMIDALLAA